MIQKRYAEFSVTPRKFCPSVHRRAVVTRFGPARRFAGKVRVVSGCYDKPIWVTLSYRIAEPPIQGWLSYLEVFPSRLPPKVTQPARAFNPCWLKLGWAAWPPPLSTSFDFVAVLRPQLFFSGVPQNKSLSRESLNDLARVFSWQLLLFCGYFIFVIFKIK